MPIRIRRFERRDREQLTALINVHVAAVIPGVVLSVNTVLSQLEREPGESIVDPWVAERCCLVAEADSRVVAAALVHRFRDDPDVAAGYRGLGDLRWFVCSVADLPAGRQLLAAAIDQTRQWGVPRVGVECALPAPGCYGVPDTMPHLRALLTEAGFGPPTRRELVLAARCADLLAAQRPSESAGAATVRTVGELGTRFTLSLDGATLGFVEVCQPSADLARNSVATHWADIGNLSVADGADPAVVMPALLSEAAKWLLLGGIDRVIDYWAADVDPPVYLEQLLSVGFRPLVTNDRGMQRAL